MSGSAAGFRASAPVKPSELTKALYQLDLMKTPPVEPAPDAAPGDDSTPECDPTVDPTCDPTTTIPLPPPPPPPVPKPVRAAIGGSQVTIAQLDKILVDHYGYRDLAYQLYEKIRALGVNPPARAGTEAVARMLGLRYNHPADQDYLDIDPDQPATRAEAAFSLAAVMRLPDWAHDAVKNTIDSWQPPALDGWQKRVLTTAFHFIGYPYIWGGESEYAQVNANGISSPGGFDCSGFVWRVYKEQAYPGSDRLNSVLRGRTTYAMSGEVGRSDRIYNPANLKPGDVLFFGNGAKSKPADNGHTGIYVGNGWFIHSSDYGVAFLPFDGWYRSSFSWARRPLREAALDR